MNKGVISSSLIIVLFFIATLLAQTEDRQLFNKGVESYRLQKYPDAQRTFFMILKNYSDSPLQTATKLMLAKSYYKLEDYPSALLVIEDFIGKYPASDYLDDIYFLKGNIDYRQRNYSQAVEDWQWIIYHGQNSQLKKTAGDYVFNTMELFLNEKEIFSPAWVLRQ